MHRNRLTTTEEWKTKHGEPGESFETIKNGSMPPDYDTWFGLHSNAKLTAAEKKETADGTSMATCEVGIHDCHIAAGVLGSERTPARGRDPTHRGPTAVRGSTPTTSPGTRTVRTRRDASTPRTD